MGLLIRDMCHDVDFLAVARLLLDNGADVNAIDYGLGGSPLLVIVRQMLDAKRQCRPVAPRTLDFVALLASRGADFDAPGFDRRTAAGLLKSHCKWLPPSSPWQALVREHIDPTFSPRIRHRRR